MTVVFGTDLDEGVLWYTRCPVPTASGIAFRLGWLTDEFSPDGLRVAALQDAGPELRGRHFDHRLRTLVREGGNIPALAARAKGEPTRLVGLTWIDEWQSILVRPGSGIDRPGALAGRRIGIPAWDGEPGTSIWRGMALAGFFGALTAGGLTFADVRVVEIPAAGNPAPRRPGDASTSLPPFAAVLDGTVDALYAKGALAAEVATASGLVVGIDLDALGGRELRVNNGTPRPITVHADLLERRGDLVVRFLAQTLRASLWAAGDLEGLRGILAAETGSGEGGVVAAYRAGFHRSLAPDLSEERLALLERQKTLLLLHGFLAADVDVARWVAPEPLAAAHRLLDERGPLWRQEIPDGRDRRPVAGVQGGHGG